MIFDGSYHQLPDTDPGETEEWLESPDAVVDKLGKNRARYLLSRLLARAQETQVSFPASVSTPYINTIPRESEPWFPGDEHIERRIRAFIRWNAAVMVSRANHTTDGIGGHLSTFASSASLYEIGFNHFFRGKDDGGAGDHVYFQGHAAPGVYARAYIEGRLTEDDLDHFRREIGRGGRGLELLVEVVLLGRELGDRAASLVEALLEIGEILGGGLVPGLGGREVLGQLIGPRAGVSLGLGEGLGIGRALRGGIGHVDHGPVGQHRQLLSFSAWLPAGCLG